MDQKDLKVTYSELVCLSIELIENNDQVVVVNNLKFPCALHRRLRHSFNQWAQHKYQFAHNLGLSQLSSKKVCDRTPIHDKYKDSSHSASYVCLKFISAPAIHCTKPVSLILNNDHYNYNSDRITPYVHEQHYKCISHFDNVYNLLCLRVIKLVSSLVNKLLIMKAGSLHCMRKLVCT